MTFPSEISCDAASLHSVYPCGPILPLFDSNPATVMLSILPNELLEPFSTLDSA